MRPQRTPSLGGFRLHSCSTSVVEMLQSLGGLCTPQRSTKRHTDVMTKGSFFNLGNHVMRFQFNRKSMLQMPDALGMKVTMKSCIAPLHQIFLPKAGNQTYPTPSPSGKEHAAICCKAEAFYGLFAIHGDFQGVIILRPEKRTLN